MRELLIYDEISDPFLASLGIGISAAMFAEVLAEYDGEDLLVRINSPGGVVADGVAIYEALRAHSGKVVTRIEGGALSIATVIAQAGERREITKTSRMMIHEGRGGGGYLTAAEHLMHAEALKGVNDTIANLYAEGKKDGPSASQFLEWMDPGKWFSANEALEAGLVSHVIDSSAETPPIFNRQRHTWVKNPPDEFATVACGRMPWHGDAATCRGVVCGQFGCPTDQAFNCRPGGCTCKGKSHGKQPSNDEKSTLAKEVEARAERRREQEKMQAELDRVLLGSK